MLNIIILILNPLPFQSLIVGKKEKEHMNCVRNLEFEIPTCFINNIIKCIIMQLGCITMDLGTLQCN
jgi:hypothetical protein